jgi:hypothetical protein
MSVPAKIWASERKPPFLSILSVKKITLLWSILNHKCLLQVTKWVSCSTVKTVQSIFARIKGQVLRPVQHISLWWRRWWWRISSKLWLIPVTRAPKFGDVFYLRSPWFTMVNFIKMPSTSITPRMWWWIWAWSGSWSANAEQWEASLTLHKGNSKWQSLKDQIYLLERE